jgi:uncharacterized protein with beta-barrel porin domain
MLRRQTESCRAKCGFPNMATLFERSWSSTPAVRHCGIVRALYLACAGAILLDASPAWSACVPNGAVASGSTVTCTGTDTTGVGDGNPNNVAVTVQPGASITLGNNASDVWLNDGNVIINNGTITAGNNAFGIRVRNNNAVTNNGAIVLGTASQGILTSSNTTIVNTGAIYLGSGIGIQSAGLSNPILNSGSITLAAGGIGLEAVGGDASPINNSGAITFLSGNGTAIFMGSANSTVTNSGAITYGNGGGRIILSQMANSGIVNSGALSVNGAGVGLQTTRANSAIVNSAAIGFSGAGSVGVETDAASSAVTNSGAITLTAAGGIGIQTLGANSGVVNSGAISVVGGPGISTAAVNSSIINSGNVTVSGDNAFAIQTIGAGSDIVNSGSVQATGTLAMGLISQFGSVFNSGTVLAPHGFGIQATGGGVSVINSGVVRGAVSLSVSGGAATVGNTGLLDGRLFIVGAGNSFINSGTVMTTTADLPIGPNQFVEATFTQTAAGVLAERVTSGGAFDSMQVTGTAHLGGTLGAVVQPGLYANATTYLGVFTASNPITTGFAQTAAFAAGTTTPLAFFTATPIYHANSVDLMLNRVPFGAAPGESQNQRNVGNALESAYATTLTGAPANLFGILLQSTSLSALTQASGEAATGSQQATFSAMTQFMGVMTDPFIAGRGDVSMTASGATSCAEDGDASACASDGKPRSTRERDAYAAIYRKAPMRNTVYDPRWSVWAAGFGGSQTTDGNAPLGSNTAASRVFGTAVGADYRFSPFTLAGFALAGGGTNFSVANSGTGRSDLFQAGAFVRHTTGPAYISAALAYGWQDITTDRTVTVAGADQLRAKFNANAYSGRVEGGYRFVTPWIGGVGLTPYAAGQVTTFDLPAYAEQVLSGANTFALGYAAKSVTDTRSELGIRTDKSFAMQDSILTLRGRFAWAHDYNPDRSIAATFQTLPGASFVVNGAAQASDSALTTASAELKWRNGFSLAATFEGEFSEVTRSYAGKGVVRYAW